MQPVPIVTSPQTSLFGRVTVIAAEEMCWEQWISVESGRRSEKGGSNRYRVKFWPLKPIYKDCGTHHFTAKDSVARTLGVLPPGIFEMQCRPDIFKTLSARWLPGVLTAKAVENQNLISPHRYPTLRSCPGFMEIRMKPQITRRTQHVQLDLWAYLSLDGKSGVPWKCLSVCNFQFAVSCKLL